MRQTLHIVRGGESSDGPGDASSGDYADTPAGVVEGDWVVYLQTMGLAPHGEPPIAPGRIDHDQLLDLIIRADRVITW